MESSGGASRSASPRRRALILAALATILHAQDVAAGKPSLNAYFQSTLRDQSYQKRTFDRVAKAWKSPPASEYPKLGSKVVVQAVIRKDGALVSTAVSTASGSKAWDDAAVAAVRGAAPFDALPAGYGHPTLEVHFHVSVVP